MLFRSLLKVLKDLGIVALIAITCIVIFSGVVFPTPFPQQSVGPFDIASFPTGISLYQLGKSPHFYSISPLDDYYLDAKSDRYPLLTAQDFQEKNFTAVVAPSSWEKYLYGLQAYFEPVPVFYTLDGKNDVQMVAEIDNQNLEIRKRVRIPSTSSTERILALGSTFKLDLQDFVFDTSGTLYTTPSPELRQKFEQQYGLPLQSFPNTTQSKLFPIPRHKVESGVVIVHNPNMTGFLIIKAQPNQELWLNLQNYLIEVIEPLPTTSTSTSQTYETTMTIGVQHSLKL